MNAMAVSLTNPDPSHMASNLLSSTCNLDPTEGYCTRSLVSSNPTLTLTLKAEAYITAVVPFPGGFDASWTGLNTGIEIIVESASGNQ
jgi:hypothetical protein